MRLQTHQASYPPANVLRPASAKRPGVRLGSENPTTVARPKHLSEIVWDAIVVNPIKHVLRGARYYVFGHRRRQEPQHIPYISPRRIQFVPDSVLEKAGWPANVSCIYSSSHQNTFSHAQKYGKPDYEMVYSRRLIDNLGRAEHKTLNQAHIGAKRQRGNLTLRRLGQEPIASNTTSQSWHKDVPRKRYVLCITGDADPNNKTWPSAQSQIDCYESAAKAFGNVLEQAYGQTRGSEVTVFMAHRPSMKRLKKEFERLKTLADPEAELLIYYVGHGGHSGEDQNLPQQLLAAQGSYAGTLMLQHFSNTQTQENTMLTEDKLKKWMKQYLIDFGAIEVVIDACHSGSFVL